MMHRFFLDNSRLGVLMQEDAHHCVSVLRLKAGDAVELLDGMGSKFQGVLMETSKTAVRVAVGARLPNTEPSVRVTLYQGIPKAEKMDGIIQKCTELGVFAIQPVYMERSIPNASKNEDKLLERWCRIAREATKQSGRGRVPMICRPIPWEQAISLQSTHALTVIPWEEARDQRIPDILCGQNDIGLVIGPEGGITAQEIAHLETIGAQVVTLGPRILRTETAGMAALASIMTITGDM